MDYIYAKNGGKPTEVEKLTTTFMPNGKIESTREIIKFLQGTRDSDKLLDMLAAGASVSYDNVYLGVANSSSAVINSTYFHERIYKGKPVAFSNASGYVFLVLPAEYDPVVAMSLIEVAMTLDGTTTINGTSYRVWKSNTQVSGSFNLYLF